MRIRKSNLRKPTFTMFHTNVGLDTLQRLKNRFYYEQHNATFLFFFSWSIEEGERDPQILEGQ